MVVFERAFHGRTLAMAELTDKPAYRDGPAACTGKRPERPVLRSRTTTDSTAQEPGGARGAPEARYPGRSPACCFELVQGEGGFHTAPREFFAALMERCREAGIAVWVDEVQTFVRTGELFAYRTLELDEYVDVATAGKMLQGSANALHGRAYNPKPGLVAGTYAGSTRGHGGGCTHHRAPRGRGLPRTRGPHRLLSRRIERRFEATSLKRIPHGGGRQRQGMGPCRPSCPGRLTRDRRTPCCRRAFEEGLMLLSAGSEARRRSACCPPVNTTDEELESAFAMLEKALARVAEELELPC